MIPLFGAFFFGGLIGLVSGVSVRPTPGCDASVDDMNQRLRAYGWHKVDQADFIDGAAYMFQRSDDGLMRMELFAETAADPADLAENSLTLVDTCRMSTGHEVYHYSSYAE